MSGFSFRYNLIPTALLFAELAYANDYVGEHTSRHKDAAWAEFQKMYKWDDSHTSIIQTIFWQKCAVRTKDNLSKERQKALQNAQIDHPGQAEEYMHEYSPWWCAPTIWVGMCEQWKAESWVKRRRTAAVNRALGAPEGNKALGTYKGGSISQLQHVAARGQHIHWLDVYVVTRDGLPEAVQIVETYNKLMDERYPEGTSRPLIDQELWERASVVKKNYVKGQGQRRRPTLSGTSSSGSQSTQLSCQPMPHTAADCVRAICRDRDLLRTLRVHLQSLDPDELADAVATAAQQETDEERPHAVADMRSQISCFLVVCAGHDDITVNTQLVLTIMLYCLKRGLHFPKGGEEGAKVVVGLPAKAADEELVLDGVAVGDVANDVEDVGVVDSSVLGFRGATRW
ncbi:hypothetical protein MRB53_021089 [Persea americana]|uniref:Uncharacterized protein n=1 Tax=Persea americana TaxID=3435 RepID=A0ACC2L3X4_PERAE|nr:hypothetical protein MRB53_021089 [Persea americana]